MSHPIQCCCGKLQGHLADIKLTNRVKCYCRDCQAFAHFLGDSGAILDRLGGSDIVQTLPKNVSFTQGTEFLACMRLTENGLLRWYSSCCNTPIGNTLSTVKMPFIGLVHNCLKSASSPNLEPAFGGLRTQLNTDSAKGEPKPQSVGLLPTILRSISRIIRARIDGSYKQTPFFSVDSDTPITPPKVLSEQEYADVMSQV
ncbi:hypothetical protein IQ266_12220 [filamentous cyanobacterium LEGE 11480]|uniref:Uncharacterized protein n=1 Tax=Romeriopsis navalis LEGE 11480 TaxID=2777977 RepID=A0A928Z3Y8_9CYAN|nr:DUF6151 family protein [Romeriopsis navalis]MBE9030497.1 hypothetical protein [Romeriopsis navalis LEGE 11480]